MKKTTGAVLGLCASGPLLLAVPVLAFGAGTASASCSTDSAQAVDTAAVATQVQAILEGGDKGSVSVPGLDDPAAVRRFLASLPDRPLVSVVMPVHDPSDADLCRALDSVLRQLYPDWELCVVDDYSTRPSVPEVLVRYAAQDPRVRVERRAVNGGIAAATNDALDRVSGEYVAFLDHDDELAPHALAAVAAALAEDGPVDLLYSDEDKIDQDGHRYEPYFKPDFNPELLLAQNYFNHLTVARTALVRDVGGLRAGFDGAQDHDLVLRLVRASVPERIRHVPHVLYHWRQYAGGHSFSRDQAARAAAAGRRAVQEHLDDSAARATVVPHPQVPLWHGVDWRAPEPLPAVTAVIPTRDRVGLLRDCVDGLLHRTDYPDLRVLVVDNDSSEPATLAYLEELEQHPDVRILRQPGSFNYSALNNRAVENVETPLVLLLNNDIVVREPDWLRRMVSLQQRPGTAIVGAKLLYGDGSVQHAGVVLGIGGVAGHAHKYASGSSTGYFGRLVITQEVSAVTGACLLISSRTYREVGGLDEVNLKIAFNDVDFCLRVREAGHRIMWCAEAELYHLESVSRGAESTPEKVQRFNAEIDHMKRRWGAVLQEDPAYNPNLTDVHEDYSLAFPPRRQLPWRE